MNTLTEDHVQYLATWLYFTKKAASMEAALEDAREQVTVANQLSAAKMSAAKHQETSCQLQGCSPTGCQSAARQRHTDHTLNLPPGGLATVPKKDRPRYRQALILAAGKTYDDLAEVTKKSPVYIGYIITDQRTGYTVRPLIAKFLGFSVADLWPDTPSQYLEAA